MLFKEMPSASDLTELRGGIALLVSLARLLSVTLACEMHVGRRSVIVKLVRYVGGNLSRGWNTSF